MRVILSDGQDAAPVVGPEVCRTRAHGSKNELLPSLDARRDHTLISPWYDAKVGLLLLLGSWQHHSSPC